MRKNFCLSQVVSCRVESRVEFGGQQSIVLSSGMQGKGQGSSPSAYLIRTSALLHLDIALSLSLKPTSHLICEFKIYQDHSLLVVYHSTSRVGRISLTQQPNINSEQRIRSSNSDFRFTSPVLPSFYTTTHSLPLFERSDPRVFFSEFISRFSYSSCCRFS